jgi:hypothetical protein
MAGSWDSIRSLVLIFLPILLPKAIGWYRSLRASVNSQAAAIRPAPARVQLVLVALTVLAAGLLVKSLPFFAPENLFWRTSSRLQIPTDTLFHRVEALRPGGALTDRDHALRAKFVSQESRLLYLLYGPDVIADCPFCSASEPNTYLYYALPAIIAPHIANLVVLAIVTSTAISSVHGARLRFPATLGAVAIAGFDIYSVSTYNHHANANAKRVQELSMFFWNARILRLVALSALDATIGFVLWLSSTNRAFVIPDPPSERVDNATRALAAAKSRLGALGIVKNTALRDDDLRGRIQAYWAHEVRLMGEVMEEREVIEGVNNALENRINIDSVTRDAEAYTQSLLRPLHHTEE